MKKIILGIVAVLIIVVIAALAWLYGGKLNAARAKAFKKIPLPVAMVGTKTVSGKEFLSRYDLAEQLYKDDPTYNATETQGQILDQLIDTAKLETVAKAHSVVVTSGEIDAQYQSVLSQFGGGNENQFKDTLNQTYHLTPEEFKSKVLRPDILQANLTIWYNSQEGLNKDAYSKQRDLLSKLDQGQAFEDVVKAYTEDQATKDFGGDTGFVKLSELAPEFKSGLAKAQSGDRLTITSRYGLHIVKVVEIDKTGDEPSYHLQQIFVQENGYDDWYKKQADAIKTRKLIKF